MLNESQNIKLPNVTINKEGGGRFWSHEIILFGTGKMAESFYIKYKDNLKIKFCLDNDKNKQGKTFHDIKVYSPYKKNIGIEKYGIIVASMSYPAISAQLQIIGLKEFENFIPITLANLIYNKNKKLAIIYGNCHTEIIEEYLSEYKSFSDKICFYPMPKTHKSNIMNFNSTSISFLKHCDLCIYQGFQDDAYGKDLVVKHILRILKKDCDFIKITNVHGHAEAFFPQITTNVGKGRDLFPYGDKNIDKLINEKKSVTEIISILKENNIYTKQQVMDNLNYQIESLIQRQEGCDIKIVDYIEQNYTKERLFNDLYHPTDFLLKEFARRILKQLNIYTDEFENVEIEKNLNTYKLPIYPCVAKHLNLEYKSDTGRLPYYNFTGEKLYSGETYGKELIFDDYIREYIKCCYGIIE